MKRLITTVLSITLVFFLATSAIIANAIPFEHANWKAASDNLITRYNGSRLAPPYGEQPYDVSHLDWLDVGLTLGQSFNSVFDQTKPGNQFEGFRFATVYEIIGLLCGPLGYTTWTVQSGESPQNILEFAGMLRIPIQGPPYSCFPGALYDYPQGPNTSGMLVYGDFGDNSIAHAVFDKSSAFPLLGSFLVREQVPAVPEPNTMLLFVVSIAGLIVTRLIRIM